jgi:DNA-directed RNA polymerase specialized sigma24 family protein
MADSTITQQEAFDRLLSWLDSDRKRAGERYESIRRKLILIFSSRGAAFPEDMADDCINRVTQKLSEIIESYEGSPEFYFVGVARNVHLEWQRKQRPIVLPVLPPNPPELEKNLACLDSCLAQLSPTSHEIVIEYYQHDRKAKIDHRAGLASRLGIAVSALRLRAHRIRQVLEKCVLECSREQSAGAV